MCKCMCKQLDIYVSSVSKWTHCRRYELSYLFAYLPEGPEVAKRATQLRATRFAFGFLPLCVRVALMQLIYNKCVFAMADIINAWTHPAGGQSVSQSARQSSKPKVQQSSRTPNQAFVHSSGEPWSRVSGVGRTTVLPFVHSLLFATPPFITPSAAYCTSPT